MKEGNIVIVPMPQSDGTVKNRPAVVLREMPPFRDLLVCGVSTQMHQAAPGFDEAIYLSDPDFKTSGLRDESLIRLGFLVVLPRTKFVGSIGSISAARHKGLLQKLGKYLTQ